jgi:hypothetical protein
MDKVERKITEAVKEIQSRQDEAFLFNLYGRWQDERMYENFSDYQKAIIERFNYLKIERVTERPFGFQFMVEQTKVFIKILKKGRYLNFEVSY